MDTTINWARIEQFIGYGREDAPIVFIGIEEGLASEDGLRSDLLLRSQFTRFMDVKAAHTGIAEGESLFSDAPRRQPTWRVMADVMLRYEGARFSDPAERARARKRYRAKRLGRSDGDSLLMELLPYPHRKNTTWLYAELSSYATRQEYENHIVPERVTILRSALRSHPRAAILCYGRSGWAQFKKLFDGVTWSFEGRFETTVWNGARVTLCDHFATKYFNTDTQMDALEAIALAR